MFRKSDPYTYTLTGSLTAAGSKEPVGLFQAQYRVAQYDDVQLLSGTAQAGVSDAYRDRLRQAGAGDTRITRAVSGRPARGVPNTIVEHLEDGPGHLGWPAQAASWRDIRMAATEKDDMEHVPLWAGQNAQAIGDTPDDAEALVGALMDDARAILQRVAREAAG